jgi:hypothetical protein
VARVNIVKRIKIGGRWKMFSIPRNAKGNYDWNAIADGRYYVEWYAGGTRRRVSAGVTAAQAIEVQRRKHHELEGRKLGIPGFETAGETVKKPALHVAITKYLEQIEALKKPNAHRKYEAVLNRFGEFFRDCVSIDAISSDDLTRFVVTLKRIMAWDPTRSCTPRSSSRSFSSAMAGAGSRKSYRSPSASHPL